MEKVFRTAVVVFWIIYLIFMYKLYLVMEEKIPEYIKTEVIRAR